MTFISGASAIFPKELKSIDSQDEWNNTIIGLASGSEQRNVNWGDSLRIFDAATAEHLTLVEVNSFRKHFNAMRASGFSFALRDRSFFQALGEPLGTGDGAATTFQLTMNDGVAANAYNKEIYLPEQSTIHVYDNAVEVVEGAGAGKFTVPYSGATAGLVTFGTAPVAAHVLTWTGNFYLPVRYALNSFPGMELFIWRTDGTGVAKGASIPIREVRYLSEV